MNGPHTKWTCLPHHLEQEFHNCCGPPIVFEDWNELVIEAKAIACACEQSRSQGVWSIYPELLSLPKNLNGTLDKTVMPH